MANVSCAFSEYSEFYVLIMNKTKNLRKNQPNLALLFNNDGLKFQKFTKYKWVLRIKWVLKKVINVVSLFWYRAVTLTEKRLIKKNRRYS